MTHWISVEILELIRASTPGLMEGARLFDIVPALVFLGLC